MMPEATSDRGRIITFYSYKGGTGRSMAVANVAWILASNSKRVLVIDWDFEAPGLHRYFHPFLKDKELTSSRGLIDFFVEFNAAARMASPSSPTEGANAWFQSYANLLPYAYSLDWDFPADTLTKKKGTLDFVPAGQQGPSYAVNVTSFDWRAFYEQLGGGVFLEAMKEKLRANYDYIIIDSRTGISDTAGICTVQMPDDIVLCFTLNQQSIKGAAAVAESASSQRLKASGEPAVRIWPVPTRVELNEKERLDAALDLASSTFKRHIGHLARAERSSYWGSVQVLYQPYFAYEEVLATFANRRGQTASILTSMEAIASYLHRSPITLGFMSETERKRGLDMFKPALPAPVTRETAIVGPRSGRVYLSYSNSDKDTVRVVADALARHGLNVRSDTVLQPGDDWTEVLPRELQSSDVVIVFLGSRYSDWQKQEVNLALKTRQRIAPILLPGITYESLPEPLSRLHATQLSASDVANDADKFAGQIAHLVALGGAPSTVAQQVIDPEDPQKGQWGGRSANNGRVLAAEVSAATADWFNIVLRVSAESGGAPLDGPVEFYLHPTFSESSVIVQPTDGRAELSLSAWGAFTVGVSADYGRTRLELDLSADESFPQTFRAR